MNRETHTKIIDVKTGLVRFKQVGDEGKTKTVSIQRLIWLTKNTDLDFTEGAGENYRAMEVTGITIDLMVFVHDFLTERFKELIARKNNTKTLANIELLFEGEEDA